MQSYIRNSVFGICKSVQTEAKRKAGIHLGIQTAHLQHGGINQTAAQNFYYTGSFARGASRSLSYGAAYVYLCARLRKREKSGAEIRLGVLSEISAEERAESSLEICK